MEHNFFHLQITRFNKTNKGKRIKYHLAFISITLNTCLCFDYTCRRRNKAPPSNRYAMALYQCAAGFSFTVADADRLYCRQGRWIGPSPICISDGGLLFLIFPLHDAMPKKNGESPFSPRALLTTLAVKLSN